MSRPTIPMLLLGATLLTAGCANSYLYDEEYSARVRAENAAATERWNNFWGGRGGGDRNYSTPGSSFDTPRCGSSGWSHTSFCIR